MSRRVLPVVLLSLAAALVAPVACAQEPPARNAGNAEEALRFGQYDEALRMARADAAREPTSAKPVRIQADVLRGTGKYAEAEEVLAGFIREHPNDASLWNRLGEVQVERGRLADAQASFQKAIAGRAPDSLMAHVNLAILQYDRGAIDSAMTAFDRFIDVYNNRRRQLTAQELEAQAQPSATDTPTSEEANPAQ